MKIKIEKWDTLDGVLDKIWLMLEQGAKFVVSGEVLGQRPMSQ